MEDAIIRCLKAILTVQGKGAILTDLWTSIETMHKMPESPAELQSLKQINDHNVSDSVSWEKILLKDEYYSLPPVVLPPSSQVPIQLSS
ncbi:hypothetical protein RvY_11577 [Ramazzottius varieornatus]|uniref:Uncharacterized protein n=1 Tax=Ramazzottius varieornatus TaxID=947166 RepID=A0A1D1VIZ8_RAMVA|nr:hypothetical protein RvY_11577 [Ramazzottius varieornatus]